MLPEVDSKTLAEVRLSELPHLDRMRLREEARFYIARYMWCPRSGKALDVDKSVAYLNVEGTVIAVIDSSVDTADMRDRLRQVSTARYVVRA